jgi:F420-0:gamma-glutamyl ligase
MKVAAIKTRKVLPGALSVLELLDESLPALSEGAIVAVTSKVVALCENSVLPIEGTDRDKLIKDEAELYFTSPAGNGHDYSFTIKQHTLIPASGIDASNGNGDYILWPKDSLATARAIRNHLIKRHGLNKVGAIITDSTIGLSRWGTIGIAIGHSGFDPIKDYVGQPDIFGKTLALTKANQAGCLASAAVFAMGEGAEQTPLAVIEDVTSIEFWPPDQTEDKSTNIYYISPLDDVLFQPFFTTVDWQKGGIAHE